LKEWKRKREDALKKTQEEGVCKKDEKRGRNDLGNIQSAVKYLPPKSVIVTLILDSQEL